MASRLRSSSVGAAPKPKVHVTSRAESAGIPVLEVRCGCQFYQSDSNYGPPSHHSPIGTRPQSRDYYGETSSPVRSSSRTSSYASSRPTSRNTNHEVIAINENVNRPMKFSRSDLIGGPPQVHFAPIQPISNHSSDQNVTTNVMVQTPQYPSQFPHSVIGGNDHQNEINQSMDNRMSPVMFQRKSRFDQYRIAYKKW